jgi:hypothetical protein
VKIGQRTNSYQHCHHISRHMLLLSVGSPRRLGYSEDRKQRPPHLCAKTRGVHGQWGWQRDKNGRTVSNPSPKRAVALIDASSAMQLCAGYGLAWMIRGPHCRLECPTVLGSSERPRKPFEKESSHETEESHSLILGAYDNSACLAKVLPS